MLIPIAIWLTCCSVVSFLQYGVDKSRAGTLKRRISEKALLLTALLGGWPGALAGSRVFRHKTRKQPYRRLLALSIVGNLALVAAACWIFWPVLGDRRL
jgi:uncharacterized membrane protein YsdA (DUF1294 family)